MKKKKAIFLDRDGTLIHDRPGFYLSHPGQIRFYKGTFEALRMLKRAGYALVVVSNQSGVGRGILSLGSLQEVHKSLRARLRDRNVPLDGIYFCPHAPRARCLCRKPGTLLARRAARDLNLTLTGACVMGDKKADVDLARALGIGSVFLKTGHGREQIRNYGKRIRASHIARNLLAGVRWFLRASQALRVLILFLLSQDILQGTELSSHTVQNPGDLIRASDAFVSSEIARVGWFPEFLEYEVRWGFLSVGTANLASRQILNFGGHPAYHITSEAISNKFCDAFYKVRDFNESWIHARTLSSLGYAKKLREGGFFRDEWVLFDEKSRVFLAKTIHKSGQFQYSRGNIPGPVQDILSSLYYIRTKPLRVGGEHVLDVNTKENWPLVLRVLRKEGLTIPAGKFECLVVEPFLRKEGIFIHKGRRLQVWLTDDGRKIPVRMSVEVFFGHVSANLIRM